MLEPKLLGSKNPVNIVFLILLNELLKINLLSETIFIFFFIINF
jgi:hypothetical protein